ncbi:MAG: hypothetical protein ACNA7E_04400 [Wenzhouxiangellaceae bacterium]
MPAMQAVPGMTETMPRPMAGMTTEAETVPAPVVPQADSVTPASVMAGSMPAAVTEAEPVPASAMAEAVSPAVPPTMMPAVMPAVMSTAVMLRISRDRREKRHGQQSDEGDGDNVRNQGTERKQAFHVGFHAGWPLRELSQQDRGHLRCISVSWQSTPAGFSEIIRSSDSTHGHKPETRPLQLRCIRLFSA